MQKNKKGFMIFTVFRFSVRITPMDDKNYDVSPLSASNTEKELLDALKKKDEAAYERLVSLYAERIYQLSFRFLRNSEDAKDILQTVFLRVLEKIDQFEGHASLYTWLYRIAVNECLMKIRAKKGKETVPFLETNFEYQDGMRVTEIPDWEMLPDQQLIEKEAHVFLYECILGLPEELRAAYILKDMEQCSEEEVCDLLHLTKSAMKNRVHRARMVLRGRIEERYVG